jgi:hypothetical protein
MQLSEAVQERLVMLALMAERLPFRPLEPFCEQLPDLLSVGNHRSRMFAGWLEWIYERPVYTHPCLNPEIKEYLTRLGEYCDQFVEEETPHFALWSLVLWVRHAEIADQVAQFVGLDGPRERIELMLQRQSTGVPADGATLHQLLTDEPGCDEDWAPGWLELMRPAA